MLHDYIELSKGDWLLQNGANSSVNLFFLDLLALHLINSLAGWSSRDPDRRRQRS
jgi:NADPH:quinone reductase-like Zn-dependent oxidoreductase